MARPLAWTPAASRMRESVTPSNAVCGTRQPVTHWTSRTTRVCGRARSSSRVYEPGRSTRPSTVRRKVAAVFSGTDETTE